MPDDGAAPTPEAFRDVVDASTGPLLVMGHNFPDPDCLAAAVAMQALLERACGRAAELAFGEGLGRAENRAMAGVFDIDVRDAGTLDPARYGGVVYVDTTPGSGNAPVLPEVPILAVLDHHDPPPEPEPAAYRDVRQDVGSTSTLLVQYFDALGAELDERLATPLLIGLRTDTEDLERDETDADVAALVRLYPLANRQQMQLVMRPPLSEEYFGLLREALARARRWEGAVIADLGPLPSPDLLSEVSELFCRLKDVELSLAVGSYEGDVYLSLRTRKPRQGVRRLLAGVVGESGRAGGHGRAAGGRLHLPDGEAPDAAAAALCQRFIEALGVSGGGPRPVAFSGAEREESTAAWPEDTP